MLWWLRQNVLVYAAHRLLQSNRKLNALCARVKNLMPLDAIHPDAYLHRINRAELSPNEAKRLMELSSSGGTFVVERKPDGKSAIPRKPGWKLAARLGQGGGALLAELRRTSFRAVKREYGLRPRCPAAMKIDGIALLRS